MKITLAKILEGLSHDTLSFMADSNHARGSIVGDQIPKVVSRINAVLRRLAVKFTLSEKSVKVDITADRQYYPMTVGSAWIVEDPEEPFTGDVARILGIELSNGRVYNLNDVAKHDSVLLRDGGKAFAIDAGLPEGLAVVTYKAATPEFDLTGENQAQEIELPESLLNALYIGVAAITYQGIGGPENITLSNSHWAQFEREIKEAQVNSAVEVEQYEERNLLKDRGFR